VEEKRRDAIMTLPDFLVMWPYDEIMVKGHRISLYHVISEHQKGKNRDELHDWYPTLEPELIGKVLDFYQANRAEVDAYVEKTRHELSVQEVIYPHVDWAAVRRGLQESKRDSEA
jgi:uncharacterized protein (DUF433 family)